ncbi:hypothetical protein XMM379_001586 [Aliiroseovarius sp. xm-m-379]|uniref:CPBP family intramembrane glutamic endopeptidase n=1 Tax=unclassified Aliiroseovarius TaxID=2623558 RepID=UPI0015682B8F|nr:MULTISPECIES: CPBP family intramembrane glutamic endopeptidase [unclassified Aliiroseovarius]NRP12523.1 hypothetical protein [Aliiroseovarius sp. xm-d-517]NRP24897.1 hypothetical protein [Aliiroseovarius sp. xm-m-379]NRP30467.1 hypothetical protein [Aliiroseovarius sp. xm-m-314]NRP33696.1 hypothetical protein [Aliiroseovarius sp. xm-a-104]NRP40803.1 hypothetical protein [Aliiroseovarius sp. xm-m-339-2]
MRARDPQSMRDVPTIAFVPFLGLTFALSWTIVGSYIFFPEVMSARFGMLSGGHPLYFLATWSPALSAVLLVIAFSGLSGLRRFLSRLLLWRMPLFWWLFILIAVPLVYMAGSLLKGGGLLSPLPPDGLGIAFAFLFMMLFLGPVEEFGWRGLAQPILQRHLAPLWAGVLIGCIWGIWHLPAFYLASTVYADWNFLPFFIGNVTLAVLVTPMFNAARGSLLVPMMFHWQLINPFWPDAQPYDTWILLGIALCVIVFMRHDLLHPNGAVTGVVVPKDPEAS